MIKNKIRVSLILIVTSIIATGVFLLVIILSIPNKYDPLPSVSDKSSKEKSIENYLLQEDRNIYFRSQDSEFFCAVEILWEYDLNDREKVVYALNQCQSVLLVDQDLRGESGGSRPPLFKLGYMNDNWVVIDVDQREFRYKSPITQDWVKEVENKIPENIKGRCFANNCFNTEGVIKKAAEHFQLKLPKYPLNACNKVNDCSSDSICVLSGEHSNEGPNTCVKKCNSNSDCGVAHTCRYQCVNGENGCPETAEKICIPDLLSPDVKKDPNSFVGFDDFEIHRRRAIEEVFPEFSEDFEKQPCFAGCSVKVVENNRIYYYAFITHGSGVPIATATCLSVSGTDSSNYGIAKIAEFPDKNNLYVAHKDIDPITCMGIK